MNIDPTVAVALISASGSVLAATIASVAAALIGKHFSNKKKLLSKLEQARNDILFLLEVEKRYGAKLQLHEDVTLKNTIRNEVRQTTNLCWSGRNTPSRIAASFVSSDE